jgi:hypothetical protein
MSAAFAQTQMYPVVARFQTILATVGAWFYRHDSGNMFAIIHREITSLLVFDNLTPRSRPTQILKRGRLTGGIKSNTF